MPRSRWSWILFALMLTSPLSARALDREFVLRWLPPAGEVSGYRVYVGTTGLAGQVLDLGAVTPDPDGIAREALQLDAAKAYTLSMTAYNPVGESTQSNQIAVPASTCDLAACNDGDPCTADDCQNFTCTHTRLPDGSVCGGSSICLSGTCRVPQCTSNAGCADGDVCDGAETCSGFTCVSGAPLSCPAPGPCQQGGCSASSGCWTTNLADGTPCNDANANTVNDQCSAGRCVGTTASTPVPPAAPAPPAQVNLTVVGNPATEPWGVEGTINDTRDVQASIYIDGVFHHAESEPYYCFPNDTGPAPSGVCTRALFGSGSHVVKFVFQLQGTSTEIGSATLTVQEGAATLPAPVCKSDSECSDGNLCNGVETCGSGGACAKGTPLVCGAATQCADPVCSPSGGCAMTPKPDGTACNDGLSSTTADRCSAGQCLGTPLVPGALSLTGVTPARVRSYGYYKLTLTGNGFAAGMKVEFRSPSMYRTPWIQKVTVTSPQKAEVLIWALPRKYSTIWDVMVTLPDGRIAGLPAAFRTDP